MPKLHFGAHAHEHVGSVACLAGVAAETAERSMIEFIKKAVRISDHFNNDAAFVKARELRDLMHTVCVKAMPNLKYPHAFSTWMFTTIWKLHVSL